MPEFRYIDLGKDVNAASLQDLQNDSWLIYPTERSCREALQAFQQRRQPLNISFLSMEEFKQRVIYSDQVCLQDEKRLVCLYQAMTAEDKAAFHIDQYPDIVDWGQHFFELFEDLAEEQVDAEHLLARIESFEVFCQEWQVINYSRMLAILGQYRDFIAAKGFTDAILDKRIAHIHLSEGIRRFIFVNQFYYSKLERSIINHLNELRLDSIIIYQGREDWLDKETLQSGEFNLAEAFPDTVLPFRLQVYETTNHWQMALAFLKDFRPEPGKEQTEHLIIDAQFLQQPYHKMFSKEHFRYPEPPQIHSTRLFHFLQIMGKGLENLVVNSGRLMVRLDWLLQAIGMDGFISYFRPLWKTGQSNEFIGFICRFSDDDVLYLDLELSILKLLDDDKVTRDNAELLAEIMALLTSLNKISSARSLALTIDSESGIQIDKLLSEAEKSCTTIQENFYTGLANFVSIDDLALVDDWRLLYPGLPLSAGIYALFLDFLKPRHYKLNLKEDHAPGATITNVMDTRNLKADKLTFLNLTEGLLPSSRTPVWLFNERQRKEIGLKTWDDVRNWERHYFYRIIATTREVNIYTVANQDRDIEPSSFLNELYDLYCTKAQTEQQAWEKVAVSADTLLKNLLRSEADNPLAQSASIAELNKPEIHTAFFNLPFAPDQDFGSQKNIALSWSSCDHFLYNPFLFFLRDVKRVRERVVRMEETLNRKMFGKLLHHYLMVITQDLAGQHDGLLSMQWNWLTKDFLQRNLDHALTTPMLAFQLPANYNREFLAEFLGPFLTDTAGKFFRVELNSRLDSAREFITLIPEQERSDEYEQQYKLLIRPDETAGNFGISIKGRADLRLETRDSRYIIDFKTGGYDELQLVLYMWFYYLIAQPELEGHIEVYFYKLLEKKLMKINTTSKFQPHKLKDVILAALAEIAANGYAPPHKIAYYDRSLPISRADLLKNVVVAKEED
jgi:hypothetical protein